MNKAEHAVMAKPGAVWLIDREGRLAYITNTYADTVSVIDIKTRAVVNTIRVGKGPNGVSVSP